MENKNQQEENLDINESHDGQQVSPILDQSNLATKYTVDEDTTSKSRTPSGSASFPSVSSLKSLFSDNSNLSKSVRIKRKRDEESGEKAVSQSKRNSQNSIKKVSVQRSVAKKLKGRARKLAKGINSHAPLNLRQNNNKDNIARYLKDLESAEVTDSYTDTSDSEASFRSLNTSLTEETVCPEVSESSEEKRENEFLHYLASIMKSAADQRLDESENADLSVTHEKEELVIQEGNSNINAPCAMEQQLSEATQQEVDAVEKNMASNPEAISALTVMEMFRQIKKEMENQAQTLRSEMRATKKPTAAMKVSDEYIGKIKDSVLEDMNTAFNQDQEKIKKLEKDLRHFKYRNRALTDIVEHMSVEMEELRSRIDGLELSSAKKSVSISGLYTTGDKQQTIAQIELFLYKSIGAEVSVDDFYKIGSTEPRLIVVSFQNSYDKRQVMQLKYHLKGLKNRDEKAFYINDFTPTQVQERRLHEKQVKKAIEDMEQPPTTTTVKGNLYINGDKYVPRIKPPSPKEIVDIDPQELAKILKMDIQSAGVITQDRSSFSGYAASVSSFQQIRQLYIKLKLMEPTARHIVCAFWIEENGQPYYEKDYCDDGEPGAGRKLLDLLIQNNIKNKVLFIARKFGGIKMGMDRFECYVQAARAVMLQSPYNSVLKEDQKITVVPFQRQPVQNKTKPPPGSPKYSRESSTPKAQRKQESVRGARAMSISRGAHQKRQYRHNENQHRRRLMQEELYKQRRSADEHYYNQQRDPSRAYSWDYRVQEDWEDERDGAFYNNYRRQGERPDVD